MTVKVRPCTCHGHVGVQRQMLTFFLAAAMQRLLTNLNCSAPVVHVGRLHCMLLRTISLMRVYSVLSIVC
jgi:hypothetical protein